MVLVCMLLLDLPWTGAIGEMWLRLFVSFGSWLGPCRVTDLNTGPGSGSRPLNLSLKWWLRSWRPTSSSSFHCWSAPACGGACDLCSMFELSQTSGFAHGSREFNYHSLRVRTAGPQGKKNARAAGLSSR
eukprot:1678017-Amphidinium_carterae.1